MSVPDDVIDMASLYLRVYFFGMPVIILYNFLASIFRSMGDTRTPLLALIIGGISNVYFNLFFVLIVHMTVMAGSAAAWNTEIVGFYVLNSFGQACTTFTAQNNGAGNEERCKKSLGWSLLLGGIFTFITCVLMLIFGHPILSLFSKNHILNH